MKRKISYRQKVILENLAPLLVILVSLMQMAGFFNSEAVWAGLMITAVLLSAFVLLSTRRRFCEPEDEMARQNQQRADALSYRLVFGAVMAALLYELLSDQPVFFDKMILGGLFGGLSLMNLLLFLYFDIRGN